MEIEYVVGCSGGNDSVALIQYMFDQNKPFFILYNDTGWAKDGWFERICDIAEWAQSKGVMMAVTQSEGMENLVKRKKGWPMPASKMQFCTQALKENPTIEFLSKIDPFKELTFVTGRRRLESANRRDMPQYQIESPRHDGRECWNPLYLHDDSMRDDLVHRTPFEILPNQSDECWPCVCANKLDFKRLSCDSSRIDQIELIELGMGHTKNEKPRTMYRPYRVGGGVGIRQAVEWGCGVRGHKASHYPDAYKIKKDEQLTDNVSDIAYDENTTEGRAFDRQCTGGYCGS